MSREVKISVPCTNAPLLLVNSETGFSDDFQVGDVLIYRDKPAGTIVAMKSRGIEFDVLSGVVVCYDGSDYPAFFHADAKDQARILMRKNKRPAPLPWESVIKLKD